MQKINYSQLELFSQEQEGFGLARPGTRSSSFLTSVRGYEKVILIIIAFVVTGIISFSLGVEKGKRLASNRTIKEQVYQPQPVTINPPQPLPASRQNASRIYTIQLASYQARASAQKEVEILKKRGFSTLVLSKGKYMVLCVGNFSNQQAAKSVLSEFEKQKRYKGCFIRRL